MFTLYAVLAARSYALNGGNMISACKVGDHFVAPLLACCLVDFA